MFEIFLSLLLLATAGGSNLARETFMPELEYELTAQRGQDVEIVLESIPGSGAIWRVNPPENVGVQVREERQPSQTMGGQTDQTFIFTFATAGRYELAFELKRPWEDVAQRDAKAVVTVR